MTGGRGKGRIAVERKRQEDRRAKLVAIDGPAGAGKSTVARQVARRLGYLYIDTGGMYRALTLKALRAGVDPGDESALARLASCTRITPDASGRILLDGEDVTAEIRCPAVSASVSRVAGWPAVREILTRRMRELAGPGGAVLEGRDVGTFVVPQADCKVFLTASPEERASRRWKELRAAGYAVSLAEVYENLVSRDRSDAGRETAPLAVADDAVVIDTTHMDVEQAVEAVLRLCTAR